MAPIISFRMLSLLVTCVPAALAFSAASTSRQLGLSNTALFGYIPDGLTKEQYEKIKKKEREAQKNLGRMGPRGFKSRSFQSFQEALERGETSHLLPVFNAKERIAKGELKKEDIPYMQRGGAWDNSDVKGARKVKWLKSDKDYATGGFKKEQSVSIFGYGEGLDWTGKKSRGGPDSVSTKPVPMGRGYKAPNVKDWGVDVKDDGKDKKKGLFGLW